MKSISSFRSKMTIPPMYIIDQIMFDDEDDVRINSNSNLGNLELISESDKRRSINKVYDDIRLGKSGERDVMYTLFSSSMNTKANRNNISNHFRLDASAAYVAACSIIDYKTPMVQNIMSDMARYMEKRKHLISAAVIKLLKRAKLSIAVYCIKNKLNNAATKCKRNLTMTTPTTTPLCKI